MSPRPSAMPPPSEGTGAQRAWDRTVDRWRRIARGDEAYGRGTRLFQARAFYLDRMLATVVRGARRRSTSVLERAGGTPLLVTLMGLSPETAIVVHDLVRPSKLLVIHSVDSSAGIGILRRHIRKRRGVGSCPVIPEPCDPTDPVQIYGAVDRHLTALPARGPGRPRAIVDITGGKKVMSVAASLAAWQLSLPICYLDHQMDASNRPKPGSESLLLLDNPSSVFGKYEMDAARDIFGAGRFDAARERFARLAQQMAEPRLAGFLRDLSATYAAWCDLSMSELRVALHQMRRWLSDRGLAGALPVDDFARIDRQVDFLKLLTGGDRASLLLSFLLLGDHYRTLGRHDFAVFLFYRAMEGCLCRRLELAYPGFDVSNPDYARITARPDDLLDAFDGAMALTGWAKRERVLPAKIGFITAAQLLFALRDPFMERAGVSAQGSLQRLARLGTIRNDSLLAHGTVAATAKHSGLVREVALSVLNAFWQMHGTGGDLESLLHDLRFVPLAGGVLG